MQHLLEKKLQVAPSDVVIGSVMGFLSKTPVVKKDTSAIDRQFETNPERFKSASIYRKSDTPKPPEAMIEAEDLLYLETSRHAEAEVTPSQTYEPNMSKVVAKKARRSDGQRSQPLRVHAVRVNPEFGKPENAGKPTEEILRKSTSESMVIGEGEIPVPAIQASLPEPLKSVLRKQSKQQPPVNTLSSDVHRPLLPDTAFSDYLEVMSKEQKKQEVNPSVTADTTGDDTKALPDTTSTSTKVRNLIHPESEAFIKPPGPITCNSRGVLTIDYDEPDANRRSGIMQRPTIPMNQAPLYQLNYIPEERERVSRQIMDANRQSTQTINLHMMSHLASISNGAPYVRSASASILDEEELVSNPISVPLSVMRSFLRAPSSLEPACIAGIDCVGLTLPIPKPFTLVAFYVLEWAEKHAVSCMTKKDVEEWQKTREMPYRDIRGVVSCDDALCLLCIIFHATVKVYSRAMDRTSQDTQRRNVDSPISCAVDTEGELPTQYCTPPGYNRFNGILEHVPTFFITLFESDGVTLVDGEYVASLKYKVKGCSSMQSQAHFQMGSKCN